MGGPEKPWLCSWHAWIRVLAGCAAGTFLAAMVAAQSSEFAKTPPGQTEIRKSKTKPAPEAMVVAPKEPPQTNKPPPPKIPDTNSQADEPAQFALATRAEVAGDASVTRFSLLLSAPISYHITTLANP